MENFLVQNKEAFESSINDILKVLRPIFNDSKFMKFIEDRISLCDFYCFNPDDGLNTVKVGEYESYTLNMQNNGGVTFTPTCNVYNSFYRPVCAVRTDDNSKNNKFLKDTIYHELVHVISTSQYQIKNSGKLYCLGLFKTQETEYENVQNSYYYLNECLTELIAKYIFDKANKDNYNIVYNHGVESKYARGYFLLAYLLLNRLERNPRELITAYLLNDTESFFSILYDETGLTEKELLKLLDIAQKSLKDFKYEVVFKYQIKKLNRKNKLQNQDVVRQYKLI